MTAERATYHHGDLRNTLLATALGVLETDGTAALGLRDLARRAGVSHAAPYAHFADKRALLVALAEIGYARLAEALDAARDAAPGDALERFATMAEAYVRFGVRNGALYRVMFESPELVGYGGSSALEIAGESAYAALEAAIADIATAEKASDGVAFSAWSLLHGIVSLVAAGRAPFEAADDTTVAHVARTAAALFAGGLIEENGQ